VAFQRLQKPGQAAPPTTAQPTAAPTTVPGTGFTRLAKPATATPARVSPAQVRPVTASRPGGQLNFGVTPKQSQAQLAKAAAVQTSGPLMGPIGAVLNFVSQPAYAVGSALQGHPLEAARHLAQLVPLVQAAEHIPGISGPAKAALSPRENILPADVSYIHRGIANLPGWAQPAVGFVANAAFDPTTYVTLGAGGALAAGAREAGQVALRQASESAVRAATEGGLSTAQRFARVGAAHADHAAAQEALRTARAPGIHVGLRVPFTRGKTVGEASIRAPKVVTRPLARVASPITRAAERIGASKPVEGVVGQFTSRGGVDRVGWAVRQGIRRAASSEKQVISQDARAFHADFTEAVGKLAKAGAKAPDGTKLTVQAAYRSLAHHIDQPQKFALAHQELQPFAEKAKGILNRYHQSETEALIGYKPVASYLPHALAKPGERMDFTRRFGKPSGTNPAFVNPRAVKSLEGLEHLGYTPEYNVAKLLEMRGHASMDALAAQQTYRVLGERVGLRKPAMGGADVGEKAISLEQAQTRLGALRAAPQMSPQVPGSGLGAEKLHRYFGTGPPITAPGAGSEILAKARGQVEKARRGVIRAQGTGDLQAIRAARQQLTRATHTHMDARAALATAQGRPAELGQQIERATRQVVKRQGELARSERQQAKAVAENQRLAKLPGRVASPEEWKQVHKDWQELPGKWLKGVNVPPETAAVINRMRDEIARSMKSPEDVNALARFAQQLTGRWKSLALLSPSYHWHNLIGDSMNAWWAGARNPLSYVQSARLLKSGKGSLAGITIKGKTYTRDQFLQLARSHGIVGSGFAGSELQGTEKMLAGSRFSRPGLQKLKPRSAPGTGAASRLSRKVGQTREDATRLGTFIERLKAGDDAITAGNKVHEYHFDYADVSPFIDHARKFWLPFITYASKAYPLTLKQIARNPGFFSHYARATETLNQQAGEPGGLPGLPVGARASFALPLPGAVQSFIGGGPGSPAIWNPEQVLPFGTLNQFDPNQIQREMTGFLNPAVKTAIELGTNYRFFYGGSAPKKAKATEPVLLAHQLLGGVADKLLGFGTTSAGKPGYSPTVDELLRLFPSYGKLAGVTDMSGPGRLATGIGSYLTGVRLTPYNRAEAIARAQKYAGR
jgi:hypothetical protein